ncbi:MAG TPA: glutathione S-transferase [Candidatus Limnocylindrales bacterium]|nr:glutathione S-transferase [Candidatus Limnocylindrales bacterium]
MSGTYTLYTMQNSPYSDKIRALLRYKRLPFDERIENGETRFTVLQARTGKTMVPVVITPDDRAINDSTTIAAHLEEAAPTPPTRWKQPVVDCLAMLLEDYADEWLVRIMLSSRWYHPADAAQNAAIIAANMTHGVYGLDFQTAARDFPPSIIATLPKMGATPENAETWYATFPRILDALDHALARSLFITGASPHQCDFAFYGQLNQIRRDPTGHDWINRGPERVREWMQRLEAACAGEEPVVSPLSDVTSLEPLLRQMAGTYLRMQVANALAVEAGATLVEAELVDGLSFRAAPARYNAKLLGNNLDLLDRVFAAGTEFPDVLFAPLRSELSSLRDAGSPLVTNRASLHAHL